MKEPGGFKQIVKEKYHTCKTACITGLACAATAMAIGCGAPLVERPIPVVFN